MTLRILFLNLKVNILGWKWAIL